MYSHPSNKKRGLTVAGRVALLVLLATAVAWIVEGWSGNEVPPAAARPADDEILRKSLGVRR